MVRQDEVPASVADPVRELMAAHRDVCERATHPLEIAAALEAAGVGAATAGRYRHADVFSLAEELFARVPRRPAGGSPSNEGTSGTPTGSDGTATGRRCRAATGVGLLGAMLLPLVTVLGSAGPPGAVEVPLVLAVAAWVAVGPADWSARWVRHAGRVQLRSAVTIAEFRGRMRPVLPVALGLQLAALAGTSFAALAVLTAVAPRPGPAGQGADLLHSVVQQAGPAQWCGQAALGLLLATAATLRRCGRRALAAAGLLGATGLGIALVALRSAGALPDWATTSGTLTALAAGAVAVLLLPCAWLTVTAPGAHR
ncbi:hypothetical protein [Kitasatospora azatica]|uniref:hypothetical protein n=1 Tax=Kitasatospora azatica TaxID=58347 RepID=UPI000566F8A9|nr:hypothetical protein [Kitasatospora azatica]